jgi:hypothetical protein
MTDKDLEKANNLKKEIGELDCFIRRAEMRWTGKIIKKDTKYIFKCNSCGGLESVEYNLNTEMKDKILDVLRDHLADLKNQLKEI